ncbi:MAG: DHHW family protein, partial [Oscillospiraceae bacterium]|nr:DHHW family protein [Oscillospiraceae bacterium]
YDSDAAYDDDAEYDSDAEYDDDPYYDDTPEDQVIRELRVTNETAPMRSQRAAAEYQAVTADAKPFVRKLAKENEKKWKKEAGSRKAEETIRRTERTSAKWNIAVCLLLLFGIAIFNLVLERPVKSMKENRMLAKMPSFSTEAYLSGKYTSGVELYYNDTVPHRDDFKEMTQVIRKHMGLSGNAVLIGDLPAAQQSDPESPAETTAPPVTTAGADVTAQTLTTVSAAVTTTTAPESDEPEREGEMGNNGVLIVNKRGIMLFGGWETMGDNYARILNRFKESAPDINMYSMVIPTVCSFYTPDEFKHLIASEKANIDYINKTLVGVTPVDVYGALEKHQDENVFMRTDHHWSSLGAFYACEAFSADARVPFARIEEYDRNSKDDYVGTLYTFSNNIILKENPEEFFWYVPRAHFTTTYYNNSFGNPREGSYFMNIDNVAPVSYYMVYMAGDDHIVRVQTDVHNGRRLCIIKDSYGNALAPWLTSSFEEIYIIDMRYFELNAITFLREHGVTDVLFAMNSFSANSDNGAKVEKIRTQ